MSRRKIVSMVIALAAIAQHTASCSIIGTSPVALFAFTRSCVWNDDLLEGDQAKKKPKTLCYPWKLTLVAQSSRSFHRL